MTHRRRLLSDRQALLAFSLLVGGWFLLNGLILFEASAPREDPTADTNPAEAIQFRPEPIEVEENGTGEPSGLVVGTPHWNEGLPWEPRDTTDRPLAAAWGLLQAAGGATLGVYGVLRWSSPVAGDWLPPGRYAGTGADEADEEE